jgi:23S rRNA (cytidine1920-2'-O)/16S rRNA (cytidine1409-2'-O)-methyltransferase
MESKRLDVLVFERGLAKSREEAQALILAGAIWSGEQRLDKAGQKVKVDISLEVRSRTPAFSSRAGHKLEHALVTFGIGVDQRYCADVGASTGGFTDCLLKRGAKGVVAIDVGYGQIDSKLRSDPRVVNLEKTNARYLEPATITSVRPDFPVGEVSLVVIDVSFISLHKVVPALVSTFSRASEWVFLFKPQFEVGREHLGKGGLVKDEAAVESALADFESAMAGLGLVRRAGPESSPLKGKKRGNVEILLHYETRH